MGDQDSLRRTGEDGKVKFWSGCLADIPLAGSPSRMGLDRKAKFRGSEGLAVNRQRGWVGLAGRRMEKESCLSRRLSPTSDWFQNRRVGRVSLVEQQV